MIYGMYTYFVSLIVMVRHVIPMHNLHSTTACHMMTHGWLEKKLWTKINTVKLDYLNPFDQLQGAQGSDHAKVRLTTVDYAHPNISPQLLCTSQNQ